MIFLRQLCSPLFKEPIFADTAACSIHAGSKALTIKYSNVTGKAVYCRDENKFPNVKLCYGTLSTTGKLACAVVAARRIESGEELRLDWCAFAIDYQHWLCRCGSPYCRGRVNSPPPERCWWWMYRFGPVPESHEKSKPPAVTFPPDLSGTDFELATCVSFPGLAECLT